MATKQICEISLHWILAARRRAHLHNYNPNIIHNYKEVLGDEGGDFGHTGASMLWTLDQAKRIDKIGIRAWINSEDALGFGHRLGFGPDWIF